VTRCPDCGEPAEPGQLVCTSCGARLALRRRRGYTGPPASALPVIAILLAVVVIGAGAFGFALSELTSDDDQVSAADREPPPAPAASSGEPQTTKQAEQQPAATETETQTAPEPPRRGVLLEWPEDLTAHTVVLVTSSDRPAARRVAEEAARSGLEAGLLHSDGYDLGTGLWIVFAGRFDTRESAARQASNLAERYPGAYAQLIRPSG
jgi:zinc-ribbon domain/SPOR domain